MSAPDKSGDPKRRYVPPKEGDWYTTHSTGVSGRIQEIVPNKTGTSRDRLRMNDGYERLTTHIPDGGN